MWAIMLIDLFALLLILLRSVRSVYRRIWGKKPGVHRFHHTLLNVGCARKVRRWPEEGITCYEAEMRTPKSIVHPFVHGGNFPQAR